MQIRELTVDLVNLDVNRLQLQTRDNWYLPEGHNTSGS